MKWDAFYLFIFLGGCILLFFDHAVMVSDQRSLFSARGPLSWIHLAAVTLASAMSLVTAWCQQGSACCQDVNVWCSRMEWSASASLEREMLYGCFCLFLLENLFCLWEGRNLVAYIKWKSFACSVWKGMECVSEYPKKLLFKRWGWVPLEMDLNFFESCYIGGASGEEPTCQCRSRKRRRFDPWVGKIPWRREWQPTPVFLSGESLWTEEPGRLQSTGSQRVGHDWNNLAHAHISYVLACYDYFYCWNVFNFRKIVDFLKNVNTY